jgi:transcriptional regulator with XRE-family HTH domain
MTFALRLKSERERLALTQAETAALLDVPARTYWEWEASKTTPYSVTQEGCLARLQAIHPQAGAL